jgi:hypothetical protein
MKTRPLATHRDLRKRLKAKPFPSLKEELAWKSHLLELFMNA